MLRILDLKSWPILFLIFTIFIGHKVQITAQQLEWPEKDLLFMYKLIYNDHPGMINEEDPNFAITLEQAFAQAQEALEASSGEQEKISLLKDFTRAFNDTHLCVSFDSKKKVTQTKESHERYKFTLKNEMDTVWIRVPIFQMHGEQIKEFDELIKQLPGISGSKKVVFDVRGNIGGNSVFASRLVAALFGREYHKYYKEKSEEKVSVDWRVTPNNIQHIHNIRLLYREQFGKESNEVQWISTLHQGMKKAYSKGLSFFTELSPRATGAKPSAHSVTAKIVVIIDSKCGSACLDFIDELYAMNYPITLIGQPTNADSVYIDIRRERLPSDKGWFYFPIKVFRNRPRGHNEPYYPDVVVSLGDEQELGKIISSL